MGRRAGLIWVTVAVVLVGSLSACGTEESTKPAERTTVRTAKQEGCRAVGRVAEGTVRLCFDPSSDDEHGSFIVEMGAMQRELEIQPPRPTPTASDAGKAGHWAWAALSPDGETLLAQWSAECEVPIAFLVQVTGTTPTPVTGEGDWARSPESVALGWTTDGRAIVFLPTGPPCGSGVDTPGIYLYSAHGRGKLLLEADRSPIRGSIEPRSVSVIRASEH